MKSEKIWSFTADDFLVSYCRGSKNKCAQCGEPLLEDDLRFGIIFTHSNNQNICVLWYHLNCTKAPLELKDIDQLHGIEDIQTGDQTLIKEWVSGAYHKNRLQLARGKSQDKNVNTEKNEINAATVAGCTRLHSDSTKDCSDAVTCSLPGLSTSRAQRSNPRKTALRPPIYGKEYTPPHKRSATDSQVFRHLDSHGKPRRPFTPNQSVIGAPAASTLQVVAHDANKENRDLPQEHQSSDEDADCDSPKENIGSTCAMEAPQKFLSCSNIPSKREMLNLDVDTDDKNNRAKEIRGALQYFAMDEAKDLIRRCASFRGVANVQEVELESKDGNNEALDDGEHKNCPALCTS